MISVQLENNGSDLSVIDKKWISNITENILMDHNHKNANILIIFSSDIHLRDLKKEYFNQDVYTDTISFNLENPKEPIDGEIYISLDRINENAVIFKQKFEREYKRVIIHSILHLMGFDDQADEEKRKMTKLEDYYLNFNKKIFIVK